MTEPKHTRGELITWTSQEDAIEKLCIEKGFETIGEAFDKANAARLVQGWNLLNRLEEMGVSDAVKEIAELRKEIQDMKDAADDAGMERDLRD